ncbi:aminotransferase [Stella sp.]|uniref:aminotransferase n=1 Tax=Stella sp. TaxID=2912054 RepID=UPI0035B18480
MAYRLNSLLGAVVEPPIAEVHGWLAGHTPPHPLIDMAQAVPRHAPPVEATRHLQERLADPEIVRYAPIIGLEPLRAAFARHLVGAYGGRIAAENVAITAGCNQAFCLALMTLAEAGDEVILPLPFYFNHQMWLDMLGIRAVHLPFRPDRGGVPDPAEAEARIGPRTRAIVLVSPNNPTGAVYPPDAIAAFADLARRNGIALVLDETYKDFLPADGAAHGLFRDDGWPETLIQLYSFSKAFAMAGHRVGAVTAAPAMIRQLTKAMDCVAISAPRIGQEAALYGLGHLAPWVAANRATMRDRVAVLEAAFRTNASGYELVSCGAYFAYVRHPHRGRTSKEVSRHLARDLGILTVPGSAFGPGQEDFIRFAFANVGAEAMPEMARRLAESRMG